MNKIRYSNWVLHNSSFRVFQVFCYFFQGKALTGVLVGCHSFCCVSWCGHDSLLWGAVLTRFLCLLGALLRSKPEVLSRCWSILGGRERDGESVACLQDLCVLLLPPLFKWWCRFKSDSSLIALASAVSVLCFSSGARGSSLPGGGSELPVRMAWPADRMAVSGCPCEVKWVSCGIQWTLTDLEHASVKEQIAHTPLRGIRITIVCWFLRVLSLLVHSLEVPARHWK